MLTTKLLELVNKDYFIRDFAFSCLATLASASAICLGAFLNLKIIPNMHKNAKNGALNMLQWHSCSPVYG